MIGIDVLCSFGTGATCACACALQLSHENYSNPPFGNKYFVYTVIILSCVFSPCNMYLLITYPGWSSMFLLHGEIINSFPILITIIIVNCTNTLFGVIGFYCVWLSIEKKCKNNCNWIVKIQRFWIYPYIIMFTILGFGYHRVLYSSNYNEYINRESHTLFSFLTSNVFLTLLPMVVIQIILLYYPWYKWSKFNWFQLSKIRTFIVKQIVFSSCIVCYFYIIFIHGYCDQEMKNYFKDDRIQFAGIYAPMVAFFIAIYSLLFLIIIPLSILIIVAANDTKQ